MTMLLKEEERSHNEFEARLSLFIDTTLTYSMSTTRNSLTTTTRPGYGRHHNYNIPCIILHILFTALGWDMSPYETVYSRYDTQG